MAEAEELVADGARELVVVAQDTTFYGMDIYGQPRLAESCSGNWKRSRAWSGSASCTSIRNTSARS